MFEGKKTTKKQKRTRLFITAVIISSMFVVRLILIQNGVITTAQDLTDEELVTRISPWEVQITTPSGTGRGTVILVSTGKKSASDTVYLISTADVVRDFDKNSTVTFSDGKAYSGEQGNLDEESNIGIVSVSAEDNRTDSAYSEDIFYQKEAGTELVWLSDDGALQKGTFTSRNAEVSGYDKAVLTAEGSMEGASEGAGLYDTTGNYIGTLITEKNGTLIAVPADQVYSYFKVNH